MRFIYTVTILFVFLLISISQADRRNYVWTYQYVTVPKGHIELELYQTTRLSARDSWEYRFEIEHGINSL